MLFTNVLQSKLSKLSRPRKLAQPAAVCVAQLEDVLQVQVLRANVVKA